MKRILGSIVAAAAVVLTSVAAPPRMVNSSDVGTIYRGPVANADWGRPLASGDFDGDGFEDVVVSASETFGGGISTVHIVRGGSGAHHRGIRNLATAPADLVIFGAEPDDNLAASIAVGDFNGDQFDDLVLCASLADVPGGAADAGIAYLLYGGTTFYAAPMRTMSNAADWDLRFFGPVAGGDMGGALVFGGLDTEGAAFGDLNNDGYDDLILGVHLANGNQSEAGRVYVKFGGPIPSGFTLNLAVASGYNLRVFGAAQFDELGTIVAAGDVTGDGIDDLILPTSYASRGVLTTEGAVYIYRGRPTWSTTLFNLAVSQADITLLGAREYDGLGNSAATGDFNGDGLGDLVVAASDADVGALNTQRGDGVIYGLLGDPALQTGTHVIDYLTDLPDFDFVGEFEENLGTTVVAGDFNGDGIDDIAASERFAGPNINGVVEVLLGRDFAPGARYMAGVDTAARITGAASDRIGFWVATTNSNGDALDEVFFSTPFNNGAAGTAYVYTYVSGDADFDLDVDLTDYAELQTCIGAVFDAPPSVPCVLIDFSLDEAVDGADVTGFARAFSGPAAY